VFVVARLRCFGDHLQRVQFAPRFIDQFTFLRAAHTRTCDRYTATQCSNYGEGPGDMAPSFFGGPLNADKKRGLRGLALALLVLRGVSWLLETKLGIERVQALADISRSALCCHINETRAPIANPPNSAQLEGTPTIPPTYIRVRTVVRTHVCKFSRTVTCFEGC